MEVVWVTLAHGFTFFAKSAVANLENVRHEIPSRAARCYLRVQRYARRQVSSSGQAVWATEPPDSQNPCQGLSRWMLTSDLSGPSLTGRRVYSSCEPWELRVL